ncbi:MAG: ScpA family protein, partial [Alphaproteobacteria bacterium]
MTGDDTANDNPEAAAGGATPPQLRVVGEGETAAGGRSAGFAEDDPAAVDGGDLVLLLDGYEGPIDVLLALAREQKVDLVQISILDLAEQYLKFVEIARHHRLELAADYLVMAAWLAYLKSRLLLPVEDEEDGPSGEELAAALT